MRNFEMLPKVHGLCSSVWVEVEEVRVEVVGLDVFVVVDLGHGDCGQANEEEGQ